MSYRTIGAWGAVGIAGVMFLATVVIAMPGVAIQPTVVTSESMEPTYSSGDVVFIDESAPVSVGDPILFSEQGTDKPILHRAVGRQSDGTYVTQGDAVPVADQRRGRAAVSADQIIGPVIQIGPVDAVIPKLGGILRLNLGTRLALAAGIVLTAIAGQIGLNGVQQRGFSVSREAVVSLVPFSLFCALVGAVYATVTTTVYEYTVASTGTSVGSVIAVGAEVSRQVTVGQTWLGPAGYTVAQSDTARVTAVSTDGDFRRISMDLPVQSSPGSLSVDLSVATYPHVLPGGVIDVLHSIHPGVAALSTAFVVGTLILICVRGGVSVATRLS